MEAPEMMTSPAPQAPAPAPKQSHAAVWFLGVLTMALIVFIVAAGIWMVQKREQITARADQAQNRIDQLEEDLAEARSAAETPEEEPAVVGAFGEILVLPADATGGYRGVAELQGYYSTMERPTNLSEDAPMVTCASFVVTDGAEAAVDYLGEEIVLGDLDASLESPWWGTPDLKTSSAENPVNAVFRIGTKFEGEMVGCFNPVVEFIGTAPSAN